HLDLLLFSSLVLRPPRPTLFPYTTLFRSFYVHPRSPPMKLVPSPVCRCRKQSPRSIPTRQNRTLVPHRESAGFLAQASSSRVARDRKSTRLNSSHVAISYAVFCLKKKTYA